MPRLKRWLWLQFGSGWSQEWRIYTTMRESEAGKGAKGRIDQGWMS